MAQFSSSDINDAKRRVQQMHQRAQSVVSQQSTENYQPPKPQTNNQNSNQPNILSLFKNFGILGNGNDSSGLILALILILSREKADNMLILALLYILL